MRTAFMFVFALSCLSLCHGQAAAQGKAAARDQIRIPQPLSIDQFYARRDPQAAPPRIRVAGFYRNSTFRTVSGATFSIDRWNGSGWTSIKKGAMNPIASGKSGAESVDLPPSNDAIKFRFVVSKSVGGSVEFNLPKQELIGVKYRCDAWQEEHFTHTNDELIGKRARDFQNQLNGLGFQTKIRYSTFDGGPFGAIGGLMRYHQWVGYRLINWREKTFATRTEMIQFHSSLPDGTTREIFVR